MKQDEIEALAKDCGGEEYGPRTWNMTFKRPHFHAFAKLVEEAERNRAAGICERLGESGSEIRLHCGEMTAQELRTARAVLRWAAAEIRNAK